MWVSGSGADDSPLIDRPDDQRRLPDCFGSSNHLPHGAARLLTGTRGFENEWLFEYRRYARLTYCCVLRYLWSLRLVPMHSWPSCMIESGYAKDHREVFLITSAGGAPSKAELWVLVRFLSIGCAKNFLDLSPLTPMKPSCPTRPGKGTAASLRSTAPCRPPPARMYCPWKRTRASW